MFGRIQPTVSFVSKSLTLLLFSRSLASLLADILEAFCGRATDFGIGASGSLPVVGSGRGHIMLR